MKTATSVTKTPAKMSGMKFAQPLVNQTPIYDGRRKHCKPAPKHRGNVRRDPKYLS